MGSLHGYINTCASTRQEGHTGDETSGQEGER